MNKKISLTVSVILLFTGALKAKFQFSSQSSTLQLSGTAAKIILSTPITDFNGTLNIAQKSSSSIQATTTSDLLTFSNGIYIPKQGDTERAGLLNRTFINATLDPRAANDAISLTNGQSLEVGNGFVIERITVKGVGNRISGQPTFMQGIGFADNTSELTLSIQNKLNVGIGLNNGSKLILGDDLSLQDDATISGGIIDINHKTLTLGAKLSEYGAWGNLTLLHANDINLTGPTSINGPWTFSGDGQSSYFNGNGCVLNLAMDGTFNTNGTITVDTNHSLYLSDMQIKGLGSGHGNIVINTGGHLYLSNVVLELSGSYEFTAGTITVAGNNCTVIAKSSNKFKITGSSAVLNVDGVALLYDSLGTGPLTPSPFVTSAGGTITYVNEGLIRPCFGDAASGSIEFTIPTASGIEILPSNQSVCPTATMTFVNENPAAKEITLDGQGFYIQFNYTTGTYITLQENLTVIFKNMLLKDFDPALIDFQGSGATKAKLILGNNVAISLSKDLNIETIPLTFKGNATIRGNNRTLTLSATNTLTIDGTDKALTVKNLRLYLTNATAMQCTNDTSKIILQDSEVHMTHLGATFAKGHLDIKNNVSILGADETSSASSTFTFSSKGLLTVLTDSIMRLEKGTLFDYAPNISGDGGNAAVSKRHLLLSNPSSTLWLDSCTVSTSSAGFALDYGRLLVDGKTTFHINATNGAEMEIGSALLVELAPGGVLDIDGALKYTETTYL